MGEFIELMKSVFSLKQTCNLCKREIFDGNYFCESCLEKIHKNDKCICECCGRASQTDSGRCISCKGDWGVDKARSVYLYEDALPQLIHQFKYGGKQYLKRIFVEKMFEIYLKFGFAPDIITYVPMHKKKLFERGYNQSQLLANELSKKVNVPTKCLLEKKFETEAQADLNYEERLKNLKGSFKVIEKVKGKRILLVDDVLTTGSTSSTIAKLLKSSGAETVFLLTIASVQKKFANLD